MTTTADDARVVWGVGTGRTIRAHWALAELGLDYRTERIRTRTPDTETDIFKRVNPRQKVPVLHDGEVQIAESAAIVTYLGENYPHPEAPLVPRAYPLRARYFEWLSFVCMELDATSLYVLRRHEALSEIYGDSPVANTAAREYFDRMIVAAGQLFGEREGYLLGDDFSGADILMGTTLRWARAYRCALPDVFDAYLERVTSRPSLAAADAANVP